MRNPLYPALIRRRPRTPHVAPSLSAINPVFKSLEPVVHAEPTETCLSTQPKPPLPRASSAQRVISSATRLGAIIAAVYCALAAPALAAQTPKSTTNGTASAAVPSRHAIAMHGEPLLTKAFTHFPYVNPDAP